MTGRSTLEFFMLWTRSMGWQASGAQDVLATMAMYAMYARCKCKFDRMTVVNIGKCMLMHILQTRLKESLTFGGFCFSGQ